MSGSGRRVKREELRQRLLDTGIELLREQGLRGGAEHVTLAAVFDRIEAQSGQRITKGSVYERIWENQRHFQLDVVAETLRTSVGREIEVVGDVVAAVLAEADLSSAAGRRRALQQLLRRAGDAYLAALLDSRTWHIWVGAWGLTASQLDGDDPDVGHLSDAIRQGFEQANDVFEAFYGTLMGMLGLELRPERTLHQFSVTAGALAHGLALRARYHPDPATVIVRPTGPDGGPEPWSLLATALEALVDSFAVAR